MKRVKTLTAVDAGDGTKVTVRIEATSNARTRQEMHVLVESLASKTMLDLSDARHINVSVSEVQVR